MTVVKSTDIDNEGTAYGSINCPICHAKVEKWIDVYKLGNMCINCAQNMMRIMFENIIKYHNRDCISLLDIMRHGNSKDEYILMYWLEERFPELYPDIGDLYYILEKQRLQEEAEYEAEHEESDGKPNAITNCEICQEPVDNWIDTYPKVSTLTGTLCIDCAQNTMKTMLEDLVEYHNGVHVSLAEIFHGWPEKDLMKSWKEKKEQQVEKLDQKSREFFDFDTECEELHK